MKTFAINWHASTGGFTRNGRTLVKANKLPRQDDAACLALAKTDAEKFAAEHGKPLKEFHVRLIGYYTPRVN